MQDGWQKYKVYRTRLENKVITKAVNNALLTLAVIDKIINLLTKHFTILKENSIWLIVMYESHVSISTSVANFH